jgi:uncharacterized protein YraI
MEEQSKNSPQAPEKESTGGIVLKVILILVGVAVVLFFGVWLGRMLGGSAAETAPTPNPANPAPTVIPPTPMPQAPYVVANDYVNVRSGPSTDYPVYGVASPGMSGEVAGVSPDGAWWAVKISTAYAPDGFGWVSAGYTTAYNTQNVPVIQPPPPPPDISPPPPEPGSVVVQTTEPVNVRAGPGNEFPSYGKVPAGTPLQAVGISSDGKWVAVNIPTTFAPNGIGWVNAAYLQPFDASSLPQLQF